MIDENSLETEYLMTVCNLTHQLVSVQQYTNIISNSSNYQLIPGLLSDLIDDPWEVILAILPQSMTNIIDVTLPFIDFDPISQKQTKILARYILYKKQVIGIKAYISTIEKSQQQLFRKYQCKQVNLPQKIIKFYQTNNILDFSKRVKVGNFYLVTNKFKIALFFQSQIKNQITLLPYIKLGCEVISIVNDQQTDYKHFVGKFADAEIRKSIEDGTITSKMIRVREVCAKYKLFLMYAGCKICPSLNQLYYSKSYIENFSSQYMGPIQTQDFNFIPVMPSENIYDIILELQYNPNLTNVSTLLDINQKTIQRQQIINSDFLFKNSTPSLQNEVQLLQPLIMDNRKFQVMPMSNQTRMKIFQYADLYESKKFQRQGLFSSECILSGKSMIRCMYLFNMMNLFILSKKKLNKTPLTIGVPFTRKTKHLFESIVYVYDKIKQFENKFVGIKKSLRFNNLVQLYRCNVDQNDFKEEQKIIKEITGDQRYTIPILSQYLAYKKQQSLIYLCSDDQTQKNIFITNCKQKKISVNFLDLILVDDFNHSLDFTNNHKIIEDFLQLQPQKNILKNFSPSIRQMDQNFYQREMKKVLLSQDYVKLKRQLSKQKFNTIQDLLKFIVLNKQFLYEEKNSIFFDDLIKFLCQKYTKNIKSINKLNKFFITNSKNEVQQKIKQICKDLMIIHQSKNKSFKITQPQIIRVYASSQDEYSENCYESKSTYEDNKRSQQNLQQNVKENVEKNEDQLHSLKLKKCKKVKLLRKKKELQNCHHCQEELRKDLMQKCKYCYQFICLECIEKLTGSNMAKAAKQVYKVCPVCNKTCICQKCQKKNNKGFQLSSQLKFQLFGQDNMISKQIKQIDSQKNIELLKKFSQEQEIQKIKRIKNCSRCELLNLGSVKSIWIECKSCGVDECFSCVRQKYQQQNYKAMSQAYFWRQWKCFICDLRWKKFLSNKKMQQQSLTDQKQKSLENKIFLNINECTPSFGKDMKQENKEFVNQNQNKEIMVDERQVKSQVNKSNVQNNNGFKYQLKSSSPNLVITNSQNYTLNSVDSAVYLPPIDPVTNVPKFPVPQKIQKQAVKQQKSSLIQQNRIPPSSLPPQPLFSISVRQNVNKNDENFKEKKQQKKSRRNSSESNNDHSDGKDSSDYKTKRNKYQIGESGPKWGRIKDNKKRGSSSQSSSSNSSLSQRSNSQSPDRSHKKTKKQKRKNHGKRKSSSSSSNNKSSDSSNSKQKKRNKKKQSKLKISIVPRSQQRQSMDRGRSRNKDEDTNTRKYYPPTKRSKSNEDKNEQLTKKVIKKDFQEEETKTQRENEKLIPKREEKKQVTLKVQQKKQQVKTQKSPLFQQVQKKKNVGYMEKQIPVPSSPSQSQSYTNKTKMTEQGRPFKREGQSRFHGKFNPYNPNFNPEYRPPIRNLANQYNTNNSFYTSYKVASTTTHQKEKQKQQKKQQVQTINKNLLFKQENKMRNTQQDDIQY